MSLTHLRKLAPFALLATLAATAPAQTVPEAAPKKPDAKTEEAIVLSEFTVSEKSGGNDYIASETMTGSRVNTKIIDLPYSIVNLTGEFFKDYNIQILDENMTYIGGLTGINIGGGFNLRGFSATSQLRDGFYRLGRYGLSNIDRVEIIRGPNAAIYGRSSPGGMVNFISLQPRKETQQTINYSLGRYHQSKATLNLTGAIGAERKNYYVLNVNQTARGFPGESFSRVRNQEYFAAVEHAFSPTSHLKFSAEFFLQTQHSPQAAAPIVSVARVADPVGTPDRNTATTTVVGYDRALAAINPFGPNSELNRGSTTLQAIYDKQINDVWSTRVGLYRFAARRWDFNQNTGYGGITIPLAAGAAVTSTRGATPSRGEIMEDGGGFQADLVARYFTFNRKVENKTLATVDLNDYYRWDPTWNYAVASNPDLVAWSAAGSGRVVTLVPGTVDGRTEYIPSAPLAYFPKFYTASDLVSSNLTRRRTVSLGGNLRQQMIMLRGDLIVYAGLRNDTVLFSQRDYTVQFASVGFGDSFPAGQGGANQPGGSVVRRYVHQNKPNAGFNYQVVPNLRVYGSLSSAYFVDQTSRPVVIAASTYQPFTSKGIDYGFKGSFFDQRLNFTLGGYYNKQFNVSVTDRVETSPGVFADVTRQDGNQLVRGWEADVSYVITPELTAGGSFGRVDSKYTFFGSAFPEVIGRSVNNITPENGSAYVKYTPGSGPLKGFYFNVLATYVSSTPTQAPNAGDTTLTTSAGTTVTAHTDAWKLRVPGFTLWNFGINYRLPRFSPRWDQKISLNLNNAFDRSYLKTSASLGDRRSVLVQYTLTHTGGVR